MCCTKDSVRSSFIPRNFGVALNGIGLMFRLRLGTHLTSFELVVKNDVSHLEGLRQSLDSLLHLATWSMAFCTCCLAASRLFAVAQTERSSIKRACSAGSPFVTLSINKRNSRGARTEPCGTPWWSFMLLLWVLPYRHRAWRFCRKAPIQLIILDGRPMASLTTAPACRVMTIQSTSPQLDSRLFITLSISNVQN